MPADSGLLCKFGSELTHLLSLSLKRRWSPSCIASCLPDMHERVAVEMRVGVDVQSDGSDFLALILLMASEGLNTVE